ncbi:hypothetical protein ACOSP7_013850 [Xanthoceras sorbifolium]
MAVSQPPPITSQMETSTQDVNQSGYHLQKFMEIMVSRITPLTEGDCSEKCRCANKGKEALPLLEPFSSESSSQTTGSSQTKRSPTRNK